MTNTTSIQALIDAVEAGSSLSGLEIDVDDRPDVSIAMWDMVVSAHNGSLDEAMALHKAVLGDMNFVVCRGYAYAGSYQGKSDNPARAWLLAILRAMLTQNNACGYTVT